VRFLPILRGRKARIDDRRFVYDNLSPANNPYTQFDDRNYEMNDVRSTTNLTAGLSGGAQDSMASFYDEVCTSFSPLSHTLRSPPRADLPLNSDNSLTLIIGSSTPIRSPPSKAV